MEVLIRKSSLNSGCLIASFDYQTVSIPKMSVLFLNCFWQRAARHQSVVTTRRSQCTLLGIEAWALSQLTFKQFNSPTSPTEPQLDPNDAVSKKFARILEREREIERDHTSTIEVLQTSLSLPLSLSFLFSHALISESGRRARGEGTCLALRPSWPQATGTVAEIPVFELVQDFAQMKQQIEYLKKSIAYVTLRHIAMSIKLLLCWFDTLNKWKGLPRCEESAVRKPGFAICQRHFRLWLPCADIHLCLCTCFANEHQHGQPLGTYGSYGSYCPSTLKYIYIINI